jgi:hypothetical protein
VAELADAVRTIIACRDLCGNEAEALRDWEADNRKLTEPERAIVRKNVEREWRGWQKAAGVTKPISAGERASINRALED